MRTSTEASSTIANVDSSLPAGARLAQSPDDVLDVDDRVVDDHPDGDHQPRQDHHVDRRAAQVEHEQGGDQRQRDRDQADERRPPLEQEGDEDQRSRAGSRAAAPCVRLSIDCSMNVAGRKIVVSISMPGQPGPHARRSPSSTPARDLQRVGAAELLDDQQQARAVVDDALAPQRLVRPRARVADVAEAQRPAAALERPGPRRAPPASSIGLDVADVQPPAVGLDEAAGADDRAVGVLQQAGIQRVGRGVHDLLERDAVARRAAPGRPGRGAAGAARRRSSTCATPGTRMQALADLPVGDRGQLDQVDARPSDRPIFMIRLVADSGGIIHGGLAHVGSSAAICASRSWTSWRARSSSVPRSKMSWIEDSCETDFERSSSRPGMPVELLLDRDRDELLDLGGGVAERDRLDLHARRRELREDVDLRARDLRDAEGDHRRPRRR